MDRGDQCPGQGTFLIHQGVQRRLRVTVQCETSASLKWRAVHEVLVGRVRRYQEVPADALDNRDVLSLNLMQPATRRIETVAVDKHHLSFQVACNWDSSLHNSPLFNCTTPSGERVFFTVSLYIQLANCAAPVCITRDLAVVVYPRDYLFHKLKSLFQMKPFSSPTPTNHPVSQLNQCVSSVYACTLQSLQAESKLEEGSATSVSTRVTPPDSAPTKYVRGEENLGGWRPRSDSLIVEHHFELERLERLQEVEKTRNLLLLRERLCLAGNMEALARLDRAGSRKRDVFAAFKLRLLGTQLASVTKKRMLSNEGTAEETGARAADDDAHSTGTVTGSQLTLDAPSPRRATESTRESVGGHTPSHSNDSYPFFYFTQVGKKWREIPPKNFDQSPDFAGATQAVKMICIAFAHYLINYQVCVKNPLVLSVT